MFRSTNSWAHATKMSVQGRATELIPRRPPKNAMHGGACSVALANELRPQVNRLFVSGHAGNKPTPNFNIQRGEEHSPPFYKYYECSVFGRWKA